MELFRAHHQWANRPPDERFQTLAELVRMCKSYAKDARESLVDWAELRVEAMGEGNQNLALVGKKDIPATVSHHAFGQLAGRAGAPASYLRTLPADLAARNLNHGLALRGTGSYDAQLLLHPSNGSGHWVLRAATTEVYERIWNWEIGERLLEMADRLGLTPAVPTFQWGNPSNATELAKKDPALYASDHDMFVFLMDRNRNVGGSADAMFRGLIVSNTEVGGTSLAMLQFLFRDLCMNHIIWGAKDVTELRVQHRGNVRGKWSDFMGQARRYLNSPVAGENAMVVASKRFSLGKDKEEVLDLLFGKRFLARKTLEAAYDAVVPEQDGDPKTAWGFTQGLTRHAQTLPYADERTAMDRHGRRVLEMAF